MAKTIQDQLAERIKTKFPSAEVKKVNQDNFLDIHLPEVNSKRGTHLFFNTASGSIKLGFYCREEDFTQQVLAKNGNLEAYSQGIRLKGNPEWKTVDAACTAAFTFVESLIGKAFQSKATSAPSVANANQGFWIFQRIKEAYPKCTINEEKSYASFTFKAAFLYELRIQKGAIRVLAANYPQKASVTKSMELIARHQLAEKSIQDRYPLLVEQGKVSPDKVTVRIEIPYQAADLENDEFITKLIATLEQFHVALMPLINGFQTQPVGKLQEIMEDGSTVTKGNLGKKNETPDAPAPSDEGISTFDSTEFDLEGRPIGEKDSPAAAQKGEKNSEEDELRLAEIMKMLEAQMEDEEPKESKKETASTSPKGSATKPSPADEIDRCLEDPIPFLTCIQLIRNYYLMLSSESKSYRASYEETLREFTLAAVVPRIADDMLRLVHEDGNLIGSLLLGPMLKAEKIYDKDFATHDDYVRSLAGVIAELLPNCNVGLFLDTLELFMYLGDMLEEEDSPSGSLNAQDRYFPLFLMLKASPDLSLANLEMVLSKDEDSRNARNGCEVKSLLLKASGNFGQLSNEEKLGLILYDFILWDEKPGLDIKRADIAAAKSIFTKVTQNAALGEQLIGGFNDNASFEIFQFFNVEFNREGFHTFCLARWKELSGEWNPLKLQLLLDGVKRDFHINTYTNNPVLKDYLKIFEGVRVLDLSESATTSELAEMMEKETKEAAAPKKQKAVPKAKEKKKKDPYTLDKSKKTLDISSLPHCILFVIFQVGFKLENYTPEEIADIQSTAVSMGEWFDMDQDECLEALEETLELLQKCKATFTLKELGKVVSACCLIIHQEVSNPGVKADIIRFMNDFANADGKVTKEEEVNLNYYSVLINFGGSMFDLE